ncbi:unnamed protein product [Pieris macdunnoughi]|uniref:Meiosis-specific nuclear structural protein 1 n=1 Tax=Pieris macdunnoughi TaxID=345717 RepID=A0A821Y866_9NEOP|nr:unnamed protein product [Pieris macdunnoughi]
MEPKTELQKNAIAEARRRELETYQRALDIQWLNSRMEDGRMGRCLALIQREAEMEKDFQERTDHAAIVNAKATREANLGMEIEKVHREEACELLRRHYLRDKDPSLRELMKKLQAGYVCRDLQQQILHNEYKRLQEKSEQNVANKILQNCLYNDQEAKEKEEKDKAEKERKYRLELQQQLVNKHLQKQCLYEESLIEKKMLEDIERTIADEDQRELQQKREQMEKCRNEMVTFKKARDAWKEKQKVMVINEERQIEEQLKAVSDRSSAIVAERERKVREKEAINGRITAKILADEAEQQKRENIIKMLQEQEHLEKNVEDDARERDKAERTKRDTRESLMSQMENRKRLAKEEKEKELVIRRQNEAKMAADEEKEREKERKKREKSEQYSRDLRKQIEANSRRRQMEHEGEENRAKYVWECDASWRKEVAEERKKIIKEHVPRVLGFLQAGVLKDEDVPHIREVTDFTIDVTSKKLQRKPKCNAQCRIIREY